MFSNKSLADIPFLAFSELSQGDSEARWRSQSNRLLRGLRPFSNLFIWRSSLVMESTQDLLNRVVFEGSVNGLSERSSEVAVLRRFVRVRGWETAGEFSNSVIYQLKSLRQASVVFENEFGQSGRHLRQHRAVKIVRGNAGVERLNTMQSLGS